MATAKADFVGSDMPGNYMNAEIRQFVLKTFPLARKQPLKNSDALLESGILDSQGVLDLVSFLEKEFSISVADDELVSENFQTIDHIVAFIESRTTRNA
jgi:acyl carrier protein